MANQEVNNARFNKEAAEWDNNKKHIESTHQAFEAIQRYVPAFANSTSKTLDVLEIGSGTGLLSYTLSPHIHSLVGVDTADGMIAAFNTKLTSHSTKNLCAINHLLTNADSPELQGACAAVRGGETNPPYRFDLVVSHLTLHHIPSLPDVFRTMYECLKPGGAVALTDYEDFGREAIRFHPESKRPGVERHGIKVDEAQEVMLGTGFSEVRVERAFVLKKEVDAEEGMEELEGEMEFPFLMFYGVRN
ncbi:S-adenosyl-L-methionine-dependent methyltransferase [Ophiobolus disseminans]|uniref:S-adenosyl-L-methionine-dependent methyltransferase n=1 Tax=Ophiobolus disseminans TaxID=1469910 RepID=A0A6A6ZZI1_9PLEO|nr:S-adenosyl-L-methionine-dependent methyltransferase [Ophiobolus disseminans]